MSIMHDILRIAGTMSFTRPLKMISANVSPSLSPPRIGATPEFNL